MLRGGTGPDEEVENEVEQILCFIVLSLSDLELWENITAFVQLNLGMFYIYFERLCSELQNVTDMADISKSLGKKFVGIQNR